MRICGVSLAAARDELAGFVVALLDRSRAAPAIFEVPAPSELTLEEPHRYTSKTNLSHTRTGTRSSPRVPGDRLAAQRSSSYASEREQPKARITSLTRTKAVSEKSLDVLTMLIYVTSTVAPLT